MTLPTAKARALRESWDAQQDYLVDRREERFETLVDLLEVAVPSRATILDLGCGTGSLTERILTRLPGARVVALDHDPVLLTIGSVGLRTGADRVAWVDADLRGAGWTRSLPA
ncbi:MAG: methyltransferase domain-containing protein, partial [Thermoplasmata archaeon]